MPHMQLCKEKAYNLLVLLLLYPAYCSATNLSQCLAVAINCANTTTCDSLNGVTTNYSLALSALRDSTGSNFSAFPDSQDSITAISYTGCVQYCGSGQEPFSWTVFSQEYAAWLLPYLALLSQLPFGARRRTDNLMSAILTLGSPTLAGYSLYMTLLNARWLNDHLFAEVDYPSAEVRQSVVRVLSNLQQVPLRIHPGKSARFESLVVHPDNDNWWITIAKDLEYSQTWSIASATSIAWVGIAYLLTVADSFTNAGDNINSKGQGTGSVWLWLLPIVLGWLILSPKCDYMRVHEAYDKANKQVFVADPRDPNAAPTQVTSKFGLTISPSPDWKLYGRNISSPDESRIPPVFNYARILRWCRTAHVTSLYYRAASRQSNHRVGVDGAQIPVNVRCDIPRECRLGNRDQILQYCRPNQHEYPGPNVLWPQRMVLSMIMASIMSLQLQWGTTGAGVLIAWFTPTTGLGCRSLAWLIYGALSTTVWILLVVSSVLGYCAHHLIDDPLSPDLESDGRATSSTPLRSSGSSSTRKEDEKDIGLSDGTSGVAAPLREFITPSGGIEGRDAPLNTNSDEPLSGATMKYSCDIGWAHAQSIAQLANWFRWIGKTIAIINAIGFITNSIFQYAGVYDNCYCNSSVFTWGTGFAYAVVAPTASDINLATKGLIGAIALVLTCCTVFIGTIFLLRDSLPRTT